MQVGLEATGAEGAAPFGAAASALLPNVTAQASHWQLADMLRLADAASGVATRMRYMHLLPPELQVTPQTPVPTLSRQVCAMWRYAVLAVRTQLRKPSVRAAHAVRRARFVSRYRTYVATCSVLHSIRKALYPVGIEQANTSAFSMPPPAATLLPWLLAHSENGPANANAGDIDASGVAWGGSTSGAHDQWCGNERKQATPEISVATGAHHKGGNDSAEVWLADAAVVASGVTSGISSVAALLLDAWERPDCCGCEVEKLDGEGGAHGATWTGESNHGAPLPL